MNTTSLLLNGRTATAISLLPEKQRATLTTLVSSPQRPRPRPRRQPSRDSPGWYNTEGGMTLDDFAQRLNTTTKRLERWQGACAQSVVMALMRPTPIVLFVFNPVSLVLWVVVALWWVRGWEGRDG